MTIRRRLLSAAALFPLTLLLGANEPQPEATLAVAVAVDSGTGSAGHATVEAGTHPKGVGLIRAFPVGSPGGGMVGMPGTFLLGRIGS